MELTQAELRKLTVGLSQIKGVGPSAFYKLMEAYGSVKEIFSAVLNNEVPIISVNHKQLLERYEQLQLEVREVSYVCCWEHHFPKNLKSTPDCPIALYYKGNYDENLINNSIAIIGTRKPTDYGVKNTQYFASELINSGFSIVSGMAFGIDKLAHIASIEAKGYTVAVLPGQPDLIIPSSNKYVYDRILNNNGLIVSEFPTSAAIVEGMYIRRNRIIAGITLGSLIIEAGEISGALATANFAFGYGREVFAVPGNINYLSSKGTNTIIKKNIAKLVEKPDDILSEFGYFNKSSVKHNIENLSEIEKKIYYVILSKPKYPEEINLQTTIEVGELARILVRLEIAGFLSKDITGKLYVN